MGEHYARSRDDQENGRMSADVLNLWDYRKPEDKAATETRLNNQNIPTVYLTHDEVEAIGLFCADQALGTEIPLDYDPRKPA